MQADLNCNTAGNASSTWPSNVNWADLLERVQDGNVIAVQELYGLISKSLLLFFRRRISVEEAEDQTHEVFLLLLHAIQNRRIENPLAFPAYAVTIAKRQAWKHYRKQNRIPSGSDGSVIEQSVADARHNPYAVFEDTERNGFVEKVLASLNQRQREILSRYYVLEQSREQICDAMALTTTQFRLLKSRAKTRFGKVGRALAPSKRINGYEAKPIASGHKLTNSLVA